MRLLEELHVTLALAGVSEDGSRFLLRNEFIRPDGKLAARVSSLGGWLDLAKRKLAPPPPGLLEAMNQMPRTEVFRLLAE